MEDDEDGVDHGHRRELEVLRGRCQQAEVISLAHVQEQEDLKETIGLLQHKLLQAGDREIEYQRKLSMFERLEPIFNNLAEQFSFETPQEVVARLEFLEQSEIDRSSQISSTLEENEQLKKRQKALCREVESLTEANKKQQQQSREK
eukprot:gene23288-28183_t